ncbi:hypothetical protein B0T14DRAFT_521775 [Immersiella caudata]|uniref:C2H2-type domain-containing protein n=1 Tax=Immersiella caudata TaxID=314043 RepID=A0AA39WS50_9PEZI|nr:hypothetical protein B0T14DRAFT_521775 [Immersiella caudata]
MAAKTTLRSLIDPSVSCCVAPSHLIPPVARPFRPPHSRFSLWLLDVLTQLVVFSALHPLKFSAHRITLTVGLLRKKCVIILHPETPSRGSKETSAGRNNDWVEPKSRRSPHVQGTAGRHTPRRRKLDDSSGRSSKPNVKRPGVAPANNGSLFGCPLYKFDPIKHRNCLVTNRLTSFSYVVQHLQRYHPVQPIHCPICGETFATREACNNHISSPRSCSPRDFHHPGLTEDQLRAIRHRRNGLDDEQSRWFDLWDGMFPETRRPDSPYVLGEAQELLQVVRRVCIIASVWLGAQLPPNQFALLDWDYITDLVSRIPYGPAEGDRSYLSSDDRVPQMPAAGSRSPSDVFSPSHTHGHLPYRPQPATFDEGWAPPFNSSPTSGSSQLSNNQLVFTDPSRSNTQSVSAWSGVNFVEELAMPEETPDQDLDMDFDPSHYYDHMGGKDPTCGQ